MVAQSKTVGVSDRQVPNTTYNEFDGPPCPLYDEQGYRIREEPLGTKRKLRVVLMGAGASSLNFFKQAELHLQNVDIVCYEKNHDIGGTWLENRYPGCACDVPIVNYQFTWKIKVWSHFYSYSPEIWEYLKEIDRENNFSEKYVKLRHQILHAQWDNESGLWRLKIKNLDTEEVFEDVAEFFINAGGVLNNWKWPDVPGLHEYKGKLMHSAHYEEGYPLAGKKVAVIGSGSSGVQIVAAIQKRVEKLYHWIRSPIWVTPGFAQTWAGRNGANFRYTEEQQDLLKKNPKKYLEYRKQIENELNQRFKFIIRGSEAAATARGAAYDQMVRDLKQDARLCDKIIPKNFNPGCRRPTPAPGYLEALTADNATIFTESIASITPTGFTDQAGEHYEADVIICATGFNTSWLPRFPLIGKEKSIHELWTPLEGVVSYLSVGTPTFPNFFSFCGPYGPLGHGSFMPLIEEWTQYMFKVIEKAQVENIKSFTPRLEVSKQFRQHADLFLKRTAWTSPCRSWFKQGKVDGQAGVWPGSRLHFLEILKTVRYEDYEIDYWDDNRFAFLGNGFASREFDGRDITNYLGLLSDEGDDTQPVYGKEMMNKMAGWAIDEKYEVTGADRDS